MRSGYFADALNTLCAVKNKINSGTEQCATQHSSINVAHGGYVTLSLPIRSVTRGIADIDEESVILPAPDMMSRGGLTAGDPKYGRAMQCQN